MFRLALESDLHFDVVAVVGFDEIGTDKEQDDMRCPHVSIDLRTPFLACTNATVMPINNQTRAAEQGELLFELVPQCFVFMRI
jgi:hypothetical protein